MGIPRYLLRILSASLAAFSGFIDAWTAAVKTSVARVTRSPLSRRYRSRMASPIRDYSPKLLARRRNESMRGAPGVSGRPSRDYPSVCRARARAAGTKRCLVAPRLHPANTQKVAPNLDYSRTMKEKSHRASRRCYRSGVDALRGTQTRRLDGHTLYSASHIQIRAERQAAGRRLRHAPRQLRWWGAPAQGDRHPVRIDQAAGRVSRGRPPAGQGSASDARIAPATTLWPRLRLRRLQRRRPAGRRCDPQAPARARSPRRAGPGFAADALAVRERVGARDLIAMGHVLADAVIEHQRRRLRGRATRITNDLDPTDDPTHGQQEFTFFNGHYDTWCYLPVVATVTFNAEAEQYAVAAVLRPGNA